MTYDVVLVDFSALLYRSYFAKRGYANQSGSASNIFHGVTQFIEIVDTLNPQSRIVFVEDRKPVAKLESFTGYKAGRVHTVNVFEYAPTLKKIVTLHPNVFFASCEGFEADDVLASIAYHVLEVGKRPLIFTHDKDFFQLISQIDVSPNVQRSVGFELVDEAEVIRKFGVPSQAVLRFRSIVGDPSDKIPPVASRLSRSIVSAFARKWVESGTFEGGSEALRKLSPTYLAKLGVSETAVENFLNRIGEVREAIERNFALMDLGKYRDASMRLKVRYYRPDPDRSLIVEHHLRQFGILIKKRGKKA